MKYVEGLHWQENMPKEGTWMPSEPDPKDMSYPLNWKPNLYGFGRIQSTNESDPIRKMVMILCKHSKITKHATQFYKIFESSIRAKDPETYYSWEEGDWDQRNAERNITEEAKYFPV